MTTPLYTTECKQGWVMYGRIGHPVLVIVHGLGGSVYMQMPKYGRYIHGRLVRW